jgi:hypothetical protein
MIQLRRARWWIIITAMLHRHIDHDRLPPAAVDDIIQRGNLDDWIRLARALRVDSTGRLHETVRGICLSRGNDSAAPVQSYAFWACYIDAHAK